jgi:hypothetical protein
VSKLEKYGALQKDFVVDFTMLKGEVLFDTRGELVIASRKALLALWAFKQWAMENKRYR